MVTETAQDSDESEEMMGRFQTNPLHNQPSVSRQQGAPSTTRISPKPITDTPVTTEQGQLFWQPEAPPVTVVERDVQRASNDPRGPRATGFCLKSDRSVRNDIMRAIFRGNPARLWWAG